MQNRVFLCPCGARLTTKLDPGWEWPLVVVWAGGFGVVSEMTQVGVLNAVVLGALSAGLLVWLSNIMFHQPQRVTPAAGKNGR